MSGTVHHSPFRHYHREQDGTVYFEINGEVWSCPDNNKVACEAAGVSCKFDLQTAIKVSEWESEELPPWREVKQALGLKLSAEDLEAWGNECVRLLRKTVEDHPAYHSAAASIGSYAEAWALIDEWEAGR